MSGVTTVYSHDYTTDSNNTWDKTDTAVNAIGGLNWVVQNGANGGVDKLSSLSTVNGTGLQFAFGALAGDLGMDASGSVGGIYIPIRNVTGLGSYEPSWPLRVYVVIGLTNADTDEDMFGVGIYNQTAPAASGSAGWTLFSGQYASASSQYILADGGSDTRYPIAAAAADCLMVQKHGTNITTAYATASSGRPPNLSSFTKCSRVGGSSTNILGATVTGNLDNIWIRGCAGNADGTFVGTLKYLRIDYIPDWNINT